MEEPIGIAVLGVLHDPFKKSLMQWISRRKTFRLCPAFKAQLGVLSPTLRRSPAVRLPKGASLVFCSECDPAAAYAARSGLLPLDIGLSHRDTLTLTSRKDSSAVIALQRPLITLRGTLLEPMEWPVALRSDLPPELLLSAAAVALLTELPFSVFPD